MHFFRLIQKIPFLYSFKKKWTSIECGGMTWWTKYKQTKPSFIVARGYKWALPPLQPPKPRENIPDPEKEPDKFNELVEKEVQLLIKLSQHKVLKKKTKQLPKAVLLSRKRKWKIKVGDMVHIRTRPFVGKRGKVKAVLKESNQVIVENINIGSVTYFNKELSNVDEVHEEKPLDYGQVMLIDPSDDKPCRTRYMFLENGIKVRASTRTGTIIPYPPNPPKKILKEVYPGDTPSDFVLEKTFTGR